MAGGAALRRGGANAHVVVEAAEYEPVPPEGAPLARSGLAFVFGGIGSVWAGMGRHPALQTAPFRT
ncbi:MAG: hypothetical protein R3F59_36345 [Myxococcota bacterium]